MQMPEDPASLVIQSKVSSPEYFPPCRESSRKGVCWRGFSAENVQFIFHPVWKTMHWLQNCLHCSQACGRAAFHFKILLAWKMRYMLHSLSTSGPNCCRALISIGKNTCYWTSPSSCYVKQPPIYTSTLIDRYIFCLRIQDITNEIFPDSRFLPQWTRCLTTSLMLLGPMTVRARETPARL